MTLPCFFKIVRVSDPLTIIWIVSPATLEVNEPEITFSSSLDQFQDSVWIKNPFYLQISVKNLENFLRAATVEKVVAVVVDAVEVVVVASVARTFLPFFFLFLFFFLWPYSTGFKLTLFSTGWLLSSSTKFILNPVLGNNGQNSQVFENLHFLLLRLWLLKNELFEF